MLSEKRLSHCQGKGSLTHNNRVFNAKNVDDTRTQNNVVFIAQPIETAYEQLFGAAVDRYNARQKRADRKINTSYYEHMFKRKISQSVVTAADKRKSFYEDVVQIGDMKNTGVGTPDAETAAVCLNEYMKGFQNRNPNFYVFNAVLHLDEATPHLHIDYIPVGHYKSGVDTRNGIAQALKEMGYGSGKEVISRWREAECRILSEICDKHGIQITAPQKSRGSLTVEQYKEYAEVKEQTEQKKEEVVKLNEQISETKATLKECSQKVTKIRAIDAIETEKAMFSGKIKVAQEDFGTLTALAKKHIAAENKESELNAEIAKLKEENEKANAKNAALQQEVRKLYPVKDALRIAENELRVLKNRYQRVLDFIEGMQLTQRLKEFLQPVRRGVKR